MDDIDTEERKERIQQNYTRIGCDCVSNNEDEGKKEDIGDKDK